MRDLLETIAPDALLDFLEEYARHDPKFDNAVHVRFAQPDFHDVLDKISVSVDTALAGVSDWDTHDRWGYVSVDTSDILFEVEQRVKRGHIRLAFAALEILYTKLLENLEYQSECELSMEAEDCLKRMEDVCAQAAGTSDRAYIFDRCIALTDLGVGKGYGADYEDKLLAMAARFVTYENRPQLEEALSRCESENGARDLALIRLDILQRLDGAKAADTFIEAHLDIEPIRKIAVERAIEQPDYARAETLCADFIRQHDDGSTWRWPKDWYTLMFSVHEKSGDIEKQSVLARKLLLEKHEYSYYAVLKKLLAEHGGWEKEYPPLREQCAGCLPGNLYMQMLREENETALLLAEVQKEQGAIFTYGAFLAESYPAESYCIYWDEIKKQSERASSRGAYQEVCKKVLLLADAGGIEDARALIGLLRQRNARRPAFLDELKQAEKRINKLLHE